MHAGMLTANVLGCPTGSAGRDRCKSFGMRLCEAHAGFIWIWCILPLTSGAVKRPCSGQALPSRSHLRQLTCRLFWLLLGYIASMQCMLSN